MKTKCKNGNTVDNWYDRRIRMPVALVRDPSGNQIGDAEYTGDRVSAKFAKNLMIKDNGGRA